MSYDTNKLLPGYTKQAFNLARANMLFKADATNEKNAVLGWGARVVIHLTCKVTEYIETPFRLIESFALTIINAIGSLFNEGCRNNLNHSFKVLRKDAKDCFLSVAIVGTAISSIVFGYHILCALLSNKDDTVKLFDKSNNKLPEEKKLKLPGSENSQTEEMKDLEANSTEKKENVEKSDKKNRVTDVTDNPASASSGAVTPPVSPREKNNVDANPQQNEDSDSDSDSEPKIVSPRATTPIEPESTTNDTLEDQQITGTG